MTKTVGIQIDADLYAEFILRSGESVDVGSWIEEIVSQYLERTEWEKVIWGDSGIKRAKEKEDANPNPELGDPDSGYRWGEVYLHNGTRIRMKYKGKNYDALVQEDEIWFEYDPFTPSQFARHVAAGTSRNAWNDLWIKFPNSSRWVLAAELRRKTKDAKPVSLADF
jgi:hypothetical protein